MSQLTSQPSIDTVFDVIQWQPMAANNILTIGNLHMSEWLREKALKERIQVSAPTIWRWVKNGTLPAPYKLGSNITAWRRGDIEQWESERKH